MHKPGILGRDQRRRGSGAVKNPNTAYILLWFPEPSETFIFREVVNLRRLGLPLTVFTLYGRLTRSLSPEMRAFSEDVCRLGIPALKHLPKDILYWRKRRPRIVRRLFRTVLPRRWRSLETTGESLWAFLCGFTLARLFKASGVEHIHAPWASGPATAAWVASILAGIPFSFTARAGDIYPPDGALCEKIQACTFVRTNTGANVEYLKRFAGPHSNKIHLIYNGFPISRFRDAPVKMAPPFRLIALGRFAGKKGYDVLLRACRLLNERGVDFHLTLAGSGPRGILLKRLCSRLGLNDRVNFPGFIPYDRVPELLCSGDIFVMPSVIDKSGDRDGIPNVIMEALLHRLPVVASNVSAIGEVIQDGKTGLLVEPGNPEALARGIEKMTNNREAALAMARNGRAVVLERFDPEQNHRKVLELYRKKITPG